MHWRVAVFLCCKAVFSLINFISFVFRVLFLWQVLGIRLGRWYFVYILLLFFLLWCSLCSLYI